MNFDMENYESESTVALLNLREQLNNEMSEAINVGNANHMLQVHKQLDGIDVRLFASTLAELHNSIRQDELRKSVLTKEIEILIQEKSIRNRKVGRAMMLLQKRQASLTRASLALHFANTDLQNLRDSLKANRLKLDSLKMAKIGEMK